MTDARDRSDAVVVTYTPCGHGRTTRRITFEPYSDDSIDAEWLRTEDVQGAEGWRRVGSEPVESLSVERAREEVADGG
jgi:hypothetical protein